MSLGKMKVLSVAALIAVSGAVQAAVSQPMHVTIEYEYAKDGEIVSRKINGEMQRYEYDLRGQLTGVYDGNGKAVEAYTYDAAGNILKKTLNGTTTTFKYDAANQLVSKEDASGLVAYAYDAAGRMIREGDKEYRYSYLDKITSVIENGETAATMDYFVGGQLASVTRGNDAERFIWDGLALVHRDGSDYLNEPAIGGGNPVASDGKVMFNDRLGSTVAVKGDESYSMTPMTAFGESSDSGAFFTGKPFVGELGYAFLMRSYRPENGKWQTADPMGYPDGWNQLAYCNNHATTHIDLLGATWYFVAPSFTEGNDDIGKTVGLFAQTAWVGVYSWFISGFENGEYSSTFSVNMYASCSAQWKWPEDLYRMESSVIGVVAFTIDGKTGSVTAAGVKRNNDPTYHAILGHTDAAYELTYTDYDFSIALDIAFGLMFNSYGDVNIGWGGKTGGKSGINFEGADEKWTPLVGVPVGKINIE